MSYASVRTAIKSILEGVSNIGIVHDYLRWTTHPSTYNTLFKSGSSVRFWSISRSAVAERRLTGQVEVEHRVVIRGYLSMDDDVQTEKTFQDLIDDVREALRSNYTLNGAALNSGPEMNTSVEHRYFGDVLCHYCEIQFPVRESMSA